MATGRGTKKTVAGTASGKVPAPSAAATAAAACVTAKAATPPVTLSVRDPGAQAAISALRFMAPREHSSGADPNAVACLARTSMLPFKAGLVIELGQCSITRLTSGRTSPSACPTLHVRVGSRGISFMSALDAHTLRLAQQNVDAWFTHHMPDEVVEDYHKGIVSSDTEKGGVVARFALQQLPGMPGVDERLMQPGGARVRKLSLRLQGLLFRRQQMHILWRVEGIELEASPLDFVARRDGHGAQDSECEDDEYEDDASSAYSNDDADGPGIEECAELRQDIMDKLIAAETAAQERVVALRDLIRVLEGASVTDVAVLSAVSERGSELLLMDQTVQGSST